MEDPFQIYPILEYTAMYVSAGGSLLMGGLIAKEYVRRWVWKDSNSSELEKMAGEINDDREIE